MKNRSAAIRAAVYTVCAVVFTVLVKKVGVEAVGPLGSEVGFASLNKTVFDLIGERKIFDILSEILAIGAVLTAAAFALKGAVQLFRKKSLFKVDFRLLCLGAVFLGVIILYFVFEKMIINYRPVTPDGVLEASYPSSHTMVTIAIFGCASVYAQSCRGYDPKLVLVLRAFCVLAPVLRLLSGQHWLTDIIGGCLFSAAFIALYRALIGAGENA